jgi:hypothetical protein
MVMRAVHRAALCLCPYTGYAWPMDIVERWHNFVATRDPALLHDLLDPDAVFESPVVHAPQRGRAISMQYLLGAVDVLGGDEFRYTGEWRSEHGVVLEFETMIDGVNVNGVDILTATTDGQRIASFKVMIRPLKAIQAVHHRMGELLALKGRRAPLPPHDARQERTGDTR